MIVKKIRRFINTVYENFERTMAIANFSLLYVLSTAKDYFNGYKIFG